MKIIDNNDFIQKTCPHCKSILAIYKEDIHAIECGSDFLICAVCGRSFNILVSEVPNHWRSYVYREFD